MEIILQFGLIAAVCLSGVVVQSLLPFFFPANVAAMLILFILLSVHAVRENHIHKASDFLIKNMAFFFIPEGVDIINSLSILSKHLLEFVFICLISTVLTFLATAYTIKFVIWLIRKIDKNQNKIQEKGGENL